MRASLLAALAGWNCLVASAQQTAVYPSTAWAVKDATTSEVTLSNAQVRLRFHHGQPRFGVFPLGYTGYSLEVFRDNQWRPVGAVPYFTAYSYRSGWGRDWLHYVVPPAVELKQGEGSATAIFKAQQTDLDRVGWNFTFTFSLRAGSPAVEVIYSARVSERRDLILFMGPRFHAGEGAFGSGKGEALFPGLEYLRGEERSSALWALAPDARLQFTPHPARITIPLMAVAADGLVVGMWWDPLQHWDATHTCPSATFASPNWIENETNHLMTLFLPSVPEFVPENGTRAQTPVLIDAGGSITLQATLFATPGAHVTDAVELWLQMHGGLPAPARPPRDEKALLNLLVKAIVDESWDARAGGWRTEYGGKASPQPATATALAKALGFIEDSALLDRARKQAEVAARGCAYLPLAFRCGDLGRAMDAKQAVAEQLMTAQQPDGSWLYSQTKIGEGGIGGLMGPPTPGYIGKEGQRTQGITAGKVAEVMDYALLTGDEPALASGLRGIADMNRYPVPYVYAQDECPPSPALHGSYFGLRACLAAYRITNDKAYLDHAVYWAKTGLPFVYLWTLPPAAATRGQVHATEKLFLKGTELYENPVRNAMLFGSLYGYGSSQFMHHWYGLLVQWIGLAYARDAAMLAAYDQTQPWDKLARGLVNSGAWQTFDREPFTGYLPDAFSVERWWPSGPGIGPGRLLDDCLAVNYGVQDFETVIIRDGARRFHVTSTRAAREAGFSEGEIRFALDDASCRQLQAVVSGVPENAGVQVDHTSLPRADNLVSVSEGWSRTKAGLLLIKVRRNSQPRELRIHLP
jgi:hypothetical protein